MDIDQQALNHLGIILDGNRRWARLNNLGVSQGHKKGYETLKQIAKAAFERGITYVSAFMFSTENWSRSKPEVNYLMRLLLWVSKHELDELNQEGIQVRFLGSADRLSKPVVEAIRRIEEMTKHNTKGTMLLCFNYGGQQEIADACQKIIESGSEKPQITPEKIEQNLYSPDVPPIDLIIRTSGEQRLSNFMLWRAAYSEFIFFKTYWPAFTVEMLDRALHEYSLRQRRFGT